MFAEQRVNKIKEIILEHEHVDINTISSLLPASIATIRRDLARLEEDGFLIRKHGGAVLNKDSIEYLDLKDANSDLYMHEKALIGLVAAELIVNGDVIFLGAGNTCWQIAKNLKDKKDLTVVTNSFNVVLELGNQSNIKLVFLGGDVEIENNKTFTTGRLALDIIRSMYIQKSFLTVNGISLDYGYSINNHFLTDMYSVLLQNSNETIVAADYSKFGKRAFRHLCNFDAVHTLVTNKTVEKDYKDYCLSHNIRLYTAVDENE